MTKLRKFQLRQQKLAQAGQTKILSYDETVMKSISKDGVKVEITSVTQKIDDQKGNTSKKVAQNVTQNTGKATEKPNESTCKEIKILKAQRDLYYNLYTNAQKENHKIYLKCEDFLSEFSGKVSALVESETKSKNKTKVKILTPARRQGNNIQKGVIDDKLCTRKDADLSENILTDLKKLVDSYFDDKFQNNFDIDHDVNNLALSFVTAIDSVSEKLIQWQLNQNRTKNEIISISSDSDYQSNSKIKTNTEETVKQIKPAKDITLPSQVTSSIHREEPPPYGSISSSTPLASKSKQVFNEKNNLFDTSAIPSAIEIPDTIHIEKEKPKTTFSFGAKGLTKNKEAPCIIKPTTTFSFGAKDLTDNKEAPYITRPKTTFSFGDNGLTKNKEAPCITKPTTTFSFGTKDLTDNKESPYITKPKTTFSFGDKGLTKNNEAPHVTTHISPISKIPIKKVEQISCTETFSFSEVKTRPKLVSHEKPKASFSFGSAKKNTFSFGTDSAKCSSGPRYTSSPIPEITKSKNNYSYNQNTFSFGTTSAKSAPVPNDNFGSAKPNTFSFGTESAKCSSGPRYTSSSIPEITKSKNNYSYPQNTFSFGTTSAKSVPAPNGKPSLGPEIANPKTNYSYTQAIIRYLRQTAVH